MRVEPVIAEAPSASSPTALALGTLCLGAAVLALLTSRRRPRTRHTVVPAQAGTHAERAAPLLSLVNANPRTVVPAQAGTHAERAGPLLSLVNASPKTVVPAQAGTHAERASPLLSLLTDTLSTVAHAEYDGTAAQAVYGSPPARGRRVGDRDQFAGAAEPPAQHGSRPAPGRRVEARGLYQASALLALSVLLDSSVEHYRGRFENPGMFAPLATSFATALTAARSAPNTAIYATALAVGAAGSAFHVYNVARRPGGFCWQNLFYAAPLGAPAALGLAGIFGLAAQRGQPSSRMLCAVAGIGMAGSSAEAALLHFRGAYHRPAMWLPVTVPPIGAIFLLRAANGARDRMARAWLGLTALLGIAGVAFHANGIARQMGGWYNWRQNVLSGPPLPAPPSFLALALAGRAALAAR